jgi:hypothetical protein
MFTLTVTVMGPPSPLASGEPPPSTTLADSRDGGVVDSSALPQKGMVMEQKWGAVLAHCLQRE